MNFGERIKRIRLQRGMTLLEVAGKLGKTEATVQRYESGNIKNTKSDTIQELADAYNVSPAYLMGWIEEQPAIVSENYYPYIASPISAGCPESVDAVTKEESISIPNSVMGKHAGNKDIQMMRVNGESMNKVIPNGSLIAVKKLPLESLQNGDVVVYGDDHEYSVKRFYNFGERLVFRPDSSDESFTERSVPADERVEIIGKVVVYIVELD